MGGQTFSWSEEDDGLFCAVLNDRVYRIRSLEDAASDPYLRSYFDLDYDYEKAMHEIAAKDDILKAAVEKKIGKLTEEKARAEKEAADLKNLPPKVEQVEDPQTVAKLKEAEAERDSALAALETAKKQLEIAADDNMARFRILFEDFQVLLDKMLGVACKMSDENRIKCVGALRSVMQGKGL